MAQLGICPLVWLSLHMRLVVRESLFCSLCLQRVSVKLIQQRGSQGFQGEWAGEEVRGVLLMPHLRYRKKRQKSQKQQRRQTQQIRRSRQAALRHLKPPRQMVVVSGRQGVRRKVNRLHWPMQGLNLWRQGLNLRCQLSGLLLLHRMRELPARNGHVML